MRRHMNRFAFEADRGLEKNVPRQGYEMTLREDILRYVHEKYKCQVFADAVRQDLGKQDD